jgi:hypothetical protein
VPRGYIVARALHICIRRYLEDLEFAVDRYIAELRSDLASFNAAKRALENKPQLI